MSEFALRSVSAPVELQFSNVPGQASCYYRAALVSPVLSGSVEVYDLDASRLCAFFDELAELWWQGWRGERVYESLERQLCLSASRDAAGHVYLKVALRSLQYEADFSWGASLTLDAGQLAGIADGLREALVESRSRTTRG